MEEEIYKKLQEIFRENFDDETIVLTAESSAEDVEDWDSIEMINLITRIEESFGFKFTVKELTEISSAKNAGEMVRCIKEKI